MSGEDLYRTHQTLINRLKDLEDEDAWAEFYQFYWHLITNWARNVGCSEDAAQDVFQETILSLMRAMPDFKLDHDRGRFRSFLKTIVTRRAADALRRENKYVQLMVKEETPGEAPEFEDIPDLAEPDEAEMDLMWAKSLMSQALSSAYQKIDPVTYKSFCLYVLDGLAVSEVIERLPGCTEAAVYKHKSRFMDILEKEFLELLARYSDSAKELELNKQGKKTFSAVFNEIIKEKPDYRDTIIAESPLKQIVKRIEFVSEILGKVTGLPEKGDFLVPFEYQGQTSRCLMVNSDESEAPREWYQVSDKCVIGRRKSCDIRLQSKDVSGVHASILCIEGNHICRDENSTNGTFINKQRLKGKRFIKDGDVLQFAHQERFVFIKK
jgi:RNA polymerase sigma-70 factor (ECF subfamily)